MWNSFVRIVVLYNNFFNRRPAARSVLTDRCSRCLVAVAVLFVCTNNAFAYYGIDAVETAGPQKAISTSPDPLDDAPETLKPSKKTTEAEQDQRRATVLYATARSLENKQQFDEALRLYQRAFRLDPKNAEIAGGIVLLAKSLDRDAEAVRYALLAVKLDKAPDPFLLRSLAAYLAQQGEWEKSQLLFQRALDMHGEMKTADDVLLLMETGRLSYVADKFKDAAACFGQVMKAFEKPDDYGLDDNVQKILLDEPGRTYQIMGESFLRADRPDDAQKAFDKEQQCEPNAAVARYHAALVLSLRGESEKAVAAFEEAFAKKLTGFGMVPYEEYAKTLKNAGKEKEIISRLESLRLKDPESAPLAYYLASLYFEANDLPKAEKLYAEWIEKTPTLTGYRQLVEIRRKNRDYDGLLTVLGEAMKRTGVLETLGAESKKIVDDQAVLNGLIETTEAKLKVSSHSLNASQCTAVALLAIEGKKFDAAGRLFKAAVDASAEQASETYLLWGVSLIVAERTQEAAAVLREALSQKGLLEDEGAFYYYLAGALALEDNAPEAMRAALVAASSKMKNADRKKLSYEYLQEKSIAELIGVYNGLVAQATRDAVRFLNRTPWILFRDRRFEESLTAYAALIDKFDADYSSNALRDDLKDLKLAASNVCVQMDRIGQAEEWLERVLDEYPEDAGGLNDLAYLWSEQNKNLNRALTMSIKALAAEPENSNFHDTLGWIYYRLGRFNDALPEIKAAADKQPEGSVMEHLGDVYQKLGQKESARSAYLRAAELFRKNKEEEKAKKAEGKI